MKIRIITDREIDTKDLDTWLNIYRDECGYPIDIDKIKTEKTATWTGDFPDVRSRATTTLAIVEDAPSPRPDFLSQALNEGDGTYRP